MLYSHHCYYGSAVVWILLVTCSFVLLLSDEGRCCCEAATASTPSSTAKHRQQSRQLLQDECDDEEIQFETFVLLDLIGAPRNLLPTDLILLQDSFLEAYNSTLSCGVVDGATSYPRMLDSISILPDAINSYGDSDKNDIVAPPSLAEASLDQMFTFLVQVSSRCTGCSKDNPKLFRSNNDDDEVPSTRRELEGTDDDDDDDDGRYLRTRTSSSHSSEPRHLQDETPIPCTSTATLCQAPKQSDFLNEFQTTFHTAASLVTMAPIVGIAEIVDVTELTEQQPESSSSSSTSIVPSPGEGAPCNETKFDRFASYVYLTLEIPSEVPPNPARQAELEEVFIEAYHAVNYLNADICDPHFRQLGEVDGRVDLDDAFFPALTTIKEDDGGSSNNGYVSMIMYVAGTCHECKSIFNLFEPENSISVYLEELMFREEQEQQGRRQLQEDNLGCFCPEDVPSRSCTEREFFDEYTTALQALSFDVNLLDMIELQPKLCSSGEDANVRFTDTVIVELEICNDSSLVNGDFGELARLFVATYNDLSREYCDEFFRSLESAEVIETGALTEDGNLPVEIRVNGRCHGCDADTVSIYDIPTIPVSVSTMMDRRKLRTQLGPLNGQFRQNTKTCYCAADPIADRAPSEAEFVSALQVEVSAAAGQQEDLRCVEGVADCLFGTIFETALYISVQNTSMVEDIDSQLESSVLETLSRLYETTDELCNPEFRVFQDVRVVDVSTLEGSDPVSRRMLTQKMITNSEVPRLLQSDGTISEEPSAAPSAAFQLPGSFLFLLFAAGVCNGCSTDLFLGNQITARRSLGQRFESIPSSLQTTPRRFLEDDDPLSYCFCPLNSTVQPVRPTLNDFRGLLQEVLDDENIALDVQDAQELDADCGSDLPDEFTSLVVISLDLSGDLSSQELETMGEFFVTSYNAVTGETCDDLFRLATQAVHDPTAVGSSVVVDGSLASFFYVTDGLCRNCGSDGRFFTEGVTNREEVIEVMGALVSAEFPDATLVDIQEVDLFFACDSEVETFKRTITVDLTVECSDFTSLSIEEEVRLAQAYVDTYNDLSLEYCDPFFRRLTMAEVAAVGDIRDGNRLPVDILVTAECQGCNTELITIYDLPNEALALLASRRRALMRDVESPISASGRMLQDGKCFCDTKSIGQRAPFESEFIDAFEDIVSNLTLACIGSVGECSFGDQFDTNIVLQFEAQNDIGSQVGIIGSTFQETANTLLGSDGTGCNRFNQIILNVTTRLQDFILDGNNLNSTVGDDSVTRRLGGPRRLQDGTSLAPSTAPTNAPTQLFNSDSIFVLLRVVGVCNGCPNDLFFFNQLTAGRRMLSESHTGDEFLRQLQTQGSTSDCFCPPNSDEEERGIDPEEFQMIFQQDLVEAGAEVVVEDVDEVIEVACTDEEKMFTSQFTYTFSAYEDSVSEPDVQGLAGIMSTVYNDLILRYCDPLTRRGVSITFNAAFGIRAVPESEERRLEVGCVNFQARFDVTGSCRGCVDGTSLFNETDSTSAGSSQARMLEDVTKALHWERSEHQSRRLQAGQQCYCDSDFAGFDRAPTIEEFSEELDKALPDATIPSICGLELSKFLTPSPAGCPVFPAGGNLTINHPMAIQRADGLCMTEANLIEVEDSFSMSYNTAKQSLYDTCDTSYRQIPSVSVGRDVLGQCQNQRNLFESIEAEENRALATPRQLQAAVTVFFAGSVHCIPGVTCTVEDFSDTRDAIIAFLESRGYIVLSFGVVTDPPSQIPSEYPSEFPSEFPSVFPTSDSESPSVLPSALPSVWPSALPSTLPSAWPSTLPSMLPSASPSILSSSPSQVPSYLPSQTPSVTPSVLPSTAPSKVASAAPSMMPSKVASAAPSVSSEPSASPTREPVTLTPIPTPGNIPYVAVPFPGGVMTCRDGLIFPNEAMFFFFEGSQREISLRTLTSSPLGLCDSCTGNVVVFNVLTAPGGDVSNPDNWSCEESSAFSQGQDDIMLDSPFARFVIAVFIGSGSGDLLNLDTASEMPSQLPSLAPSSRPSMVPSAAPSPTPIVLNPIPTSGNTPYVFQSFPSGVMECMDKPSLPDEAMFFFFEGSQREIAMQVLTSDPIEGCACTGNIVVFSVETPPGGDDADPDNWTCEDSFEFTRGSDNIAFDSQRIVIAVFIGSGGGELLNLDVASAMPSQSPTPAPTPFPLTPIPASNEFYVSQTVPPDLPALPIDFLAHPYMDAMFFYYDESPGDIFVSGRTSDMGSFPQCTSCGETYWVFQVADENDPPSNWFLIDANSWGSSFMVETGGLGPLVVAVRRTEELTAFLSLELFVS